MARVSADVRRAELVQAAIRVMARDGVEKATTRAIVTEAGMQLGFFHYCFRSKEELLEQVILAINEENLRIAIRNLKRHSDVEDMLRAIMRAYWKHVEKNPGVHQLTYELTQYALRKPGLAELAGKQYENYFAIAAEVLDAVAEAAGVEWTVPVPVLARFLNTMIDGATLAWVVDRDRKQSLAVGEQAIQHLVACSRPAA